MIYQNSMKIDLSGQIAIVTGGSRGIGRATCRLLCRAGADVVFGYHRNQDAANSLIAEIREEGGRVEGRAGDVAERSSIQELFAAADETFGEPDIVVGNAGIWERGPIDEMSEQEWSRTLDINLRSIYYTCHLAARSMKPRGRGKIILVSSTAGQRGEAFYSHYAASKGAIISMTKSLAAELGPRGIRVNCVAPGWVDTDMARAVLEEPRQAQAIRDQIPLRRIPSPEDIAGPIVFLASSLARHVHGEILNVNGGAVLCG